MNRGIFRMLLMFGPMIFRAVQKFMKKRNAAPPQRQGKINEERRNQEEPTYRKEEGPVEETETKPKYDEDDLL